MTYYLLLSCILLLIFTYVIYFIGKIPKKINWVIVYSPTIFSSLIICLYLLSGTSKPLDIRKIEYTAVGMKHLKNSDKELFTGVYKTQVGSFEEFEIPKATYNYFKDLWIGKKEITLSEDSLGYTKFLEWDKKPNNALVYTKQEPYINYFKTSLGLYDFYEVSLNQAREEKLFNRSRVDHVNSISNILEPRQSLVYGIEVPDSICRALSNISSLDPEFRPILCVWIDSILLSDPETLVKHQRSFWGGGKNNEVVFCVGIDNLKSKEIKWSYSFSWSITPDFEKYVKTNSLAPGKKLDLSSYKEKVVQGYSKGLWHPRDFDSYKILSLPISDFTVIMSCILIIIVNIVMSMRIKK